MIRPIQSAQNDNFKIWKLLDNSKGIKKHQCFFLMGERLIREFLKNPQFKILAEVMGPDHRPLTEGKAFDQVPKYQLTKELFEEVDSIGTHFNLLLLALPEIPEGNLEKPQNLELVLPLGDPSNLGAAVRSACAFGIKKIHLPNEAANPFHPKAVKASAGAVLQVQFRKTSSLKELLSEAGRKDLFTLGLHGENMVRFQWPKDLFLVAGEEGPGLPEHHYPQIHIPIQNVESLNAAASVSLACYSYSNQKR